MDGLFYFQAPMKLRTRIVLAMLTLVVFSLITIGGFTIWFFKEQNEEYHFERLKRKEEAVRKEMEYFTAEMKLQDSTDIVIRELEQQVLRMSNVHDMEINLFNTRGELMISSEWAKENSDYYNKSVPENALLLLQDTNRIVIPEQEEDRFYLSDYIMIENEAAEKIAIVNLPYIRNRDVNQKDLEEFLGSLGVMYIFIFMGAIGLTILLSRSITRSLGILGDKMGSIAFTGENEPLIWRKNDEIGQLVESYNAMLEKLSESRKALAKSERESAWREMAKQVAHEIKNPLTPMKLSIQHLMATAGDKDEKWQRKFDETSAMLIEQIESLSRIASEFSDFAKMPKANVQVFPVSEIINNSKTLFSEAPFILETELGDPDIKVRMDKDHLQRVLSNLVKNAKQALAEQENGSVIISVSQRKDQCLIEIRDNGPGIPAEIKSKIFEPNFTTKSSGTGLGLAITKEIIEEAKGRIWFKSVPGNGTSFFIEIPIAE